MSNDFQDRIARLNAKNGAQPSQTPLPPSRNGGGGDGPRGPKGKGPKGSMVKYMVLGILILVVMPIGAAMGTIYFAQNQDQIASASQDSNETAFGLSLLKTMYVEGNDDPEVRDARKSIHTMGVRLTAGAMSKEEAEYYSTLEGQMELADQAKKAYNFDKLTEKAKDYYGK